MSPWISQLFSVQQEKAENWEEGAQKRCPLGFQYQQTKKKVIKRRWKNKGQCIKKTFVCRNILRISVPANSNKCIHIYLFTLLAYSCNNSTPFPAEEIKLTLRMKQIEMRTCKVPKDIYFSGQYNELSSLCVDGNKGNMAAGQPGNWRKAATSVKTAEHLTVGGKQTFHSDKSDRANCRPAHRNTERLRPLLPGDQY